MFEVNMDSLMRCRLGCLRFFTFGQKGRSPGLRQKDKKMGHPTSNSAGFMTAQGPEETQKCIFNNKPLFLFTGLFGLLG